MRAYMMMRWPCGSCWMQLDCGGMRKSMMDRSRNMAGVRPEAAAQGQELKIAAIADGAKDNWSGLESLILDIRLIDVWQAGLSLKAAADAATGTESAKSTVWFGTHKAILTDDPRSVG